jgi:PAN domain
MEPEQELSLSLLGQEYDALLTQYQQAYTNYVDYLSSSESSSNSGVYATLKGRTFWGTGGVSEGASNTVEECQGLCSSISTCTGATFNPDKKYCWARTGEGDVIPGLDNDVAIVPKAKQYMDVLYTINTQLISLNKQMMDITAATVPTLTNERDTRSNVNEELIANYQHLLDEQKRVELLIREYESLEDVNNNASISVKQKYSVYISIALFFIVLIILFVLFNFM